MHRKQPLRSLPFQEYFREYATGLLGLEKRCRSVISIKMHSSNFVGMESFFGIRCSPVSLLHVFGAHYYNMISEELFSIHLILQINSIGNVNICIIRPDDKTIIFSRSLQICINSKIGTSMKGFIQSQHPSVAWTAESFQLCMGKSFQGFFFENISCKRQFFLPYYAKGEVFH